MKIIKQKNYGVIIEDKPKIFRVGGESGLVYSEVNKSGNWDQFLPSKETQYIFNFDTMSCVTFSALNVIETYIDFLVANNLIAADKLQQLKDWGFFDANGKFNCSDRFTAKMSGTTKNGNSLPNVWDCINNIGLVPEAMWPSTGIQKWDDYMAEIPLDVKNFAKNILTILDFKYEWIVAGMCGVPDKALIQKQLKHGPLQIAAGCIGMGTDGIYHNPGCYTQHATEIYNADDFFYQFDHYASNYNKKLALDYEMPWIMKGVVLVKTPTPTPVVTPFGHKFNIQVNYGETSEEVKWLQLALIRLGFKTYATGYYGPWTKQAVIDFQKKYNLATLADILYINGRWVGPKTRLKLNQLLS